MSLLWEARTGGIPTPSGISSTACPADFLATAGAELGGTSETANYGPPYNHGTTNVQRLGVSPQSFIGIHEPIDSAQVFVLGPLSKLAPANPTLASALARYQRANASVQAGWNRAYAESITRVRFQRGAPVLSGSGAGPVPVLIAKELTLAREGALDADLLASRAFYGTNFTKPLLFLEDGQYYAAKAQAQHLVGSQWGVMNETGSYPGQPWLWLYTLWYQLPGFKTSANVDLIAVALTALATLVLLAVPFLPGVRDIPRLIPVHRLIWAKWSGEEPS